jgi:uncharacterized RDD family membrane protein YckC
MSEGTPPPPPPENPEGGAPPPYGQTPPPPAGPPGGYGAPPPPPPPGGPGGYAAAPPPPPQAPLGRRPGSLLDRFVARLLDGILIGIVNAIIVTILVVGIIGLNGANSFGYGGSYAASIVSAVIGVVINLGYFVLMETSQGKTLGKMVMKLHVEGASGGNPTPEESLKRNWWLALPLLAVVPLVGGLIGGLAELVVVIVIAVQINSDPEGRPSLSDRLADTRVIKEG